MRGMALPLSLETGNTASRQERQALKKRREHEKSHCIPVMPPILCGANKMAAVVKNLVLT